MLGAFVSALGAFFSLQDRAPASRHVVSNAYAYAHTAPEAGFDVAEFPGVRAWLRRVEQQPGFVNDLAPYPANAAPGAGKSAYD